MIFAKHWAATLDDYAIDLAWSLITWAFPGLLVPSFMLMSAGKLPF